MRYVASCRRPPQSDDAIEPTSALRVSGLASRLGYSTVKRQCSIAGCSLPARGRGLCTMHYGRWRRHGDALVAPPYVHRLTDVDPASRTAVCAKCGPVRIHKQAKTWKCAQRERTGTRSHTSARRRSLRVELLEAQGGVCAICGGSDPRSRLGWHLDHDHETGAVRGVLCYSCNVILLRYDAPTLRRALDYLSSPLTGHRY